MGNSAYHFAVANDQVNLVKVLEKYDADATVLNLQGDSPLYIAIKEQKKEVLQLLAPKYQKLIQKNGWEKDV